MTPSRLPPAASFGRQFVDVQAMAEKLGCSTRHVYRLADAGRMPPPVRLGRLVRWDLAEIETWVTAGCPPASKGGVK